MEKEKMASSCDSCGHDHDHEEMSCEGCGHDHEHDHEMDVVELYDEAGNPTPFSVIANLEVDEQEYAILASVEDEDEVLIFKVTEDVDGFVFESIQEDAEIDAVINAYNELLEESEEEL